MKVALVHDWLIHMRGGEKVLESFAELYPDATIHTLFYRRETLSPSLQRMKIKPSFLHYLPGIRLYYRWLLPFLPYVVQTLQIDAETDLVISSSHCVAKGVRIPSKAKHICYSHTPMRYLWGFEEEYFNSMPFFMKPLLYMVLVGLRKWDLKTNARVDQFIANSENVRMRIQQFYERDAVVVHPPFDRSFFYPQPKSDTDPYYLVVSAFVPYKRVDLVIEAFNALDRTLLIVGSGPMSARYRKLRKSSKISFLGAVPGRELARLYAGARAVIFPTNEDFGIVPLEAQACGTPVIALGKGGALESVKHGTFFREQSTEAIRAAVLKFENMNFSHENIPEAVEGFEKQRFKERIRQFVSSFMSAPQGSHA